jgi:hypothetical protein
MSGHPPIRYDPNGDYHRYILREIRSAALRAKLAHNDLVAIGIALKAGFIGPDQALEELAARDVIHLVAPNSTVPP